MIPHPFRIVWYGDTTAPIALQMGGKFYDWDKLKALLTPEMLATVEIVNDEKEAP